MAGFNMQNIEQVLKNRFFIAPSAHIYGGVSGLFDLGPPGQSLKLNLIDIWRKHFVLEESMLELDTSVFLPYAVLKASGHVDKFCDVLVFDEVTGDAYRADHLLTEQLEKLIKEKAKKQEDGVKNSGLKENGCEVKNNMRNKTCDVRNSSASVEADLLRVDCMTTGEVDEIVQRYEILSPLNNRLSKARYFNLMFDTSIGYKSHNKAYLRPETAQGQFLNFKKLYEFNSKRLPFASASVGRSFRNEISPRGGLTRTREFEQAEIEYYVPADSKDHPKFCKVSNIVLVLVFNGEAHSMSIGDAVANGFVNNQTLGYFIGRTYLFLIKVGVSSECIRFRQHKKDEMAHYATDCWDAEILMSYGWVECVGIADRSCYDLKCHSTGSGVSLMCERMYAEPRRVKEWTIQLDKRVLGKQLRGDFAELQSIVDSFSQEDIINGIKDENLNAFGRYEVSTDEQTTLSSSEDTMATCETNQNIDTLANAFITVPFKNQMIRLHCKKVDKLVCSENIVPDVIEPSFGIGRIMHAILEHTFYMRDEKRAVFKFPYELAPIHCVITYLIHNNKFDEDILATKAYLDKNNIKTQVNDRSCSIGRKYSSCDELGVPFFITFDQETLNDRCVTIRERDSMQQIRVDVLDVGRVVKKLVVGDLTWEKLSSA